MATQAKRPGSHHRIAATTLLIAALLVLPGFASTPTTSTTAGNLALRLDICKGPLFLDGVGSAQMLLSSFCFLQEEDRDSLQTQQAIEVLLSHKPEVLEVDLALLSRAPNGTWGGERRDLGRVHLAAGETVVLEDLEAFGIEPLSLSAIPYRPPGLVPTRLVNQTDSIKAVVVQEGWTWIEVAITNLSQKTVNHLEVIQLSAPSQGRGVSRMFPNPTVAPGESGEIRLRVERRLLGSDEGFAPDPRIPTVLEISSVVFRDGSFEGQKPVHSANLGRSRNSSQLD